jgi:hypothetical protein
MHAVEATRRYNATAFLLLHSCLAHWLCEKSSGSKLGESYPLQAGGGGSAPVGCYPVHSKHFTPELALESMGQLPVMTG